MRKRKHKQLADGDNQEDYQSSDKWAAWGCGCLAFGSILAVFLFLSNAIAFTIVKSSSSLWPMWAGLLVGGAITFALIAVLWAIGGDFMDRLVRILIVTVMCIILIPVFDKAREDAKKRNKQEAMKTIKKNSTEPIHEETQTINRQRE